MTRNRNRATPRPGIPHDTPRSADDPFAPENLLGFVDWFEVHDWARLEAALAARPDVEGDRSKGWTWFDNASARREPIAEIEEEDEGHLAVETYTEADADRCLEALEEDAGSAVRFLIGQACYRPYGVTKS